MDALTKVLVSLYEEAEKPDDALEYPFLVYGFPLLHSAASLYCIDWYVGESKVTCFAQHTIQYIFGMLIFSVHCIQILVTWTQTSHSFFTFINLSSEFTKQTLVFQKYGFQ
jgi:hypothetical protein